MSTLKVGAIRGVSASSDAITVANDGTCTANITNNLSNRNLIINGAMRVAQRGTSSTSGGYQTVDRFRCNFSGNDENGTQAQHALTSSDTGPYEEGFRFSYHVTNGNQTSGAGADDAVEFLSKFEAQDIANSGWDYTSTSSYLTLSFWVKSSVAQNFFGYIKTADGTPQNFPYQTGSLSANTWTKITKTIPGNSNLQFDNDANEGMRITWAAFNGTNRTASGVSLDTWVAYADGTRMPDFTSTWYTTNDATFEITGVQLEVGDHATDFEHRSFADEIIRCERYYRRDAADGVVYYRFCLGQCTSSTGTQATVKWPTRMRAAPTFATSGTLKGYTVNSQKTPSSFALLDQTTQGGIVTYSASGLSAGNCVDLIAGNDGDAYIEFIAEL